MILYVACGVLSAACLAMLAVAVAYHDRCNELRDQVELETRRRVAAENLCRVTALKWNQCLDQLAARAFDQRR